MEAELTAFLARILIPRLALGEAELRASLVRPAVSLLRNHLRRLLRRHDSPQFSRPPHSLGRHVAQRSLLSPPA